MLPPRKPVRSLPAGNRKWNTSAQVYIDCDFSGFNELLKGLEGDIAEAAEDALKRGLDEVHETSKELVPVNKQNVPTRGQLKDTSYVITDSDVLSGVSGEIVYSATNPKDNYNYAYVQEVRDDWTHLPGRQSRYLETAWLRHKKDVSNLVRRAVNRAVRQKAADANRKAASAIRTSPKPSKSSKPNIISRVGEKLKKFPVIGKFFRGGKKK